MALSDGERWIAAENVSRFLRLLAEEQDPEKRQRLQDLLQREREKLKKE